MHTHGSARSCENTHEEWRRNNDIVDLTHTAERSLALELLGFSSVIREVERTLEFHRLATSLYTLATRFMSFYETCPVLRAEGPTLTARLVLCELTARTLAVGLSLLGIHAGADVAQSWQVATRGSCRQLAQVARAALLAPRSRRLQRRWPHAARTSRAAFELARQPVHRAQ
jgi:hypothetical protein